MDLGSTNSLEEERKSEESLLSTEESKSPSKYYKKKPFKEKSELCWKFMEYGVCPYKLKCKFAHGSHELTRNQGANLKYKTKECISYFRDASCHFGMRCNFLHIKKEDIDDEKW